MSAMLRALIGTTSIRMPWGRHAESVLMPGKCQLSGMDSTATDGRPCSCTTPQPAGHQVSQGMQARSLA